MMKGSGKEGVKNGIGLREPIVPTVKVAGASPGYDPFTKSISKGMAMSVGPVEISKATGSPGKAYSKSMPTARTKMRKTI